MQSNQIIVTGNLGGNPEHYKKSDDSAGVITFSLAEVRSGADLPDFGDF
jgi:hypothetical protein